MEKVLDIKEKDLERIKFPISYSLHNKGMFAFFSYQDT